MPQNIKKQIKKDKRVSFTNKDFTSLRNELQRYAAGGSILEVPMKSNSFTELFGYLKEKDFKNMRQWVTNNIDTDASAIFRGVYDNALENLKPESLPQLILILADYQYKHAFVADHELNVVACLTEVMANVEFK